MRLDKSETDKKGLNGKKKENREGLKRGTLKESYSFFTSYCLFNDAFGIPDGIASNERIITK